MQSTDSSNSATSKRFPKIVLSVVAGILIAAHIRISNPFLPMSDFLASYAFVIWPVVVASIWLIVAIFVRMRARYLIASSLVITILANIVSGAVDLIWEPHDKLVE